MPAQRQTNLSMNFIINLLESEGYNIIIIWVDYLTKLRHFILTINKVTAQGIVRLFIENIYKYYRFLKIIMSN